MNKTEVMKKLESLGSEQTRKTWRRHGATEPMFGVKYGDLAKVIKQIGADQKLALELWKTGNHDARTLATMIADPAQMTQQQLDEWAKTASNQLSLDAVALLAMKTPHAKKCFDKWRKSKHEWTAAAAWHLLAGGCCGRPGANAIADLTDDELTGHLDHIEQCIHTSPNRVRYSMNAAVIGIGSRGGAMMKKAIATAKRIGTVDVDHGDTSCTTPDAASYIEKMMARKSGAAKRTSKSAPKQLTAKKTPAKKKPATKAAAGGKSSSRTTTRKKSATRR